MIHVQNLFIYISYINNSDKIIYWKTSSNTKYQDLLTSLNIIINNKNFDKIV